MGGALAYTVIKKYPESYTGVVLMSPMCKLADDVMPSEFVVGLLPKLAGPTGTATAFGYLPLAPTAAKLHKFVFKLNEKRLEFMRHPAVFQRNARLATAREILVSYKRWYMFLS
jgi:caffeoylshikimate esterase